MARFIVRRLAGMVLVLFAVSVLVFAIFNVIPNSDPGPAPGRQERDPDPGQEHRRGLGLRRTGLGPVRVDDEEALHRRTDLLRRTAQRRSTGSSKGSPRPSRSAIGAAVIWLFFGVLFGYLSATRAGGWLDRVLTVALGRGDLDPGLPARHPLPLLPHLQDRTVPGQRLRAARGRPGPVGLPPDPALVHAGDPQHRLLQPGAALEHARRDARGLRPHRPRQGPRRAPGA